MPTFPAGGGERVVCEMFFNRDKAAGNVNYAYLCLKYQFLYLSPQKKEVMKKTLLFFTACALMASCQNTAKTTGAEVEEAAVADTLYYEGVVPAADGPGVRYEIALAQDSTMGVRMTETYLEAENGKDMTTQYVGKAEQVVEQRGGVEVRGLKLDFENEDFYFVQKGDTTLRMVNSDWEEAASGLNYDLKRK